MDLWMNAWMDGRIDWWAHAFMGAWTHKCMDAKTGWTDECRKLVRILTCLLPLFHFPISHQYAQRPLILSHINLLIHHPSIQQSLDHIPIKSTLLYHIIILLIHRAIHFIYPSLHPEHSNSFRSSVPIICIMLNILVRAYGYSSAATVWIGYPELFIPLKII